MKKILVAISLVVAVGLVFGVYRQMVVVKNVVVVYSPHQGDFMETLNRLFEEKNPGIKVQLVRGTTTQLEGRIFAERSHPVADVMFGGDAGTYIQMKNNGLLEPVVLSMADKLPVDMRDGLGYWYAPYRLTGVFFYNNQLVLPEQVPKDWDDLTDLKWKNALMMLNPTLSGTARTFLISLVEAWGKDEAFHFFDKLNQQLDGKYATSPDDLFTAVARGDAKVSLWHESDILKLKYNQGMPFDLVYPSSGTYKNPEPIAVIAGAPHKEAAIQYLEFVFEAPTLEVTANEFMKRPTRTDIPKNKLPEPLRNEPKTFIINWEAIGDKGATWLREWSELINRAEPLRTRGEE